MCDDGFAELTVLKKRLESLGVKIRGDPYDDIKRQQVYQVAIYDVIPRTQLSLVVVNKPRRSRVVKASTNRTYTGSLPNVQG